MEDTITVIVEELLNWFRPEAETIGEAACCDGDYKDEAREIAQSAISRAQR